MLKMRSKTLWTSPEALRLSASNAAEPMEPVFVNRFKGTLKYLSALKIIILLGGGKLI